jgi:hypothetical protein
MKIDSDIKFGLTDWLERSMTTELKDGRKFELNQGMPDQVGDNSYSHRTFSKNGVKLFIVD